MFKIKGILWQLTSTTVGQRNLEGRRHYIQGHRIEKELFYLRETDTGWILENERHTALGTFPTANAAAHAAA